MSANSGWKARLPAEVVTELRPPEVAAAEAAALRSELPAVLARFPDNEVAARENLSHLSGLLRATEDQAARLAERGFFRGLWGRLTGEAPKSAEEVRDRLTEVQTRAVAVTERLLERQVYLEQSTHYLGARTELMALENVKLKAVLVRLGQRIFDRFERLEDRVERLERRSDGMERRIALSELFQSAFSPALNCAYMEIDDPVVRALTLAHDFATASGGDWRPIDLHRLKRLALGELNAAQRSFSVEELVKRSLAQLTGSDTPLMSWLQAGGLADRLMAPMDDDIASARSFYPLHFLLQRPRWFLAQGLPRPTAVAVIVQELKHYGLDLEERVDLWQVVSLLLEERLAWQMESGEAPTLAGSAPAAALMAPREILPVDLLVVQALFRVGHETVGLTLDGVSAVPALQVLTDEGPQPVHPGPPTPELATTRSRWAVDGDTLLTLSADRRAVLSGTRDGSRWRWTHHGLSPMAGLIGVAGRAGEILAWDRGNVFRIGGEGGRGQAPRAVLDAAGGTRGFYLLARDHVQLWVGDGPPLEWGQLPRGHIAQALAVAPGPDERPFVLTKVATGGYALVCLNPEPVFVPLPGSARFAPLLDGRALLVDESGRLALWDPTRGAALRNLDAHGGGLVEKLAVGADGRAAVLSRDDARVVVFTPPAG
jgi:hypothetical protein